MRGAEGVIDKNLGQSGKTGGQGAVVILLACVKAGVFQQQDFSRLESCGFGPGLVTDAVGGESDWTAKQRTQRGRDWRQGLAGVRLALGAAKVLG